MPDGLDHSPLWGESIGAADWWGVPRPSIAHRAPTKFHVNQEPPTSSLRSLTPPKGESVQNRTVGPIAQPDTLEGESIGGADWWGVVRHRSRTRATPDFLRRRSAERGYCFYGGPAVGGPAVGAQTG